MEEIINVCNDSIILQYLKERIVYTMSYNRYIWFCFNKHRWNPITSRELQIIIKLSIHKKKGIYNIKIMNDYITILKDKTFDREFVNKLDIDMSLIGFKNGVFDIKNNIFRSGKPNDYISCITNHKYKPYNEDTKQYKNLMDLFKKIYTDPIVREYTLNYFANSLVGGNSKVHVLLGGSDSAKSTILRLIVSSFGGYVYTINRDIISKETYIYSHNSNIISSLNSARVILVQEMELGNILNIDKLVNIQNFNPYINKSIMLQSNIDIPIEVDNIKTWDKIHKDIHHTSQFVVDNDRYPVSKSIEKQYNMRRFKANYDISENIDELSECFIYFLCERIRINNQ